MKTVKKCVFLKEGFKEQRRHLGSFSGTRGSIMKDIKVNGR